MRTLQTLVVAALLVTTSACGTEDGTRADDPAGGPTPASTMPTAIPAADGEVHTDGLVTVLDDGDGPELCLGAVAESSPPQCSGVPLAGWSWADNPVHERKGKVRWGSFAVTGTWDGGTFTATSATPAALYDPLAEPAEESTIACAEPEGGWTVVDESRATSAALDETLRVAGQLPGYAGSWLVESGDPAATVVNVAVTEDVEGAEAALRRTWGGPLCVGEAAYTEQELTELTLELQELPGVLSTSAAGDVVEAVVVFDDGSIQEWADETYGEGRVEISPALRASGSD